MNVAPYFIESCPCPRVIRAAWMYYPPYTNVKDVIMENGRPAKKDGIFEEYLVKMVNEVCTGCTKVKNPFIPYASNRLLASLDPTT